MSAPGEKAPSVLWDWGVRGLQLRIGKHRNSWYYYRQRQQHGRRQTTCKLLGHFPLMNVAQAREAARVIAGAAVVPGKRAAIKFDAAIAQYLEHLERRATKAGKPARWHRNVEYLVKQLILPEWSKWPLAEMSASPEAVARWHRKVSKDNGPVSANHCCRIIRACYRRAARLDRSLPPGLPTSAVEFNREAIGGHGIDDFKAWGRAWHAIGNPVHRAYHLTCLLTGCRPGELARLKWADVLPRERVFVIRAAKAGADIRVPLSIGIVRALKMARSADILVFPDCSQRGRHDKLPARGVALRRTYRTIAAEVGIDEMLAHFLMGHAPAGISQRYVARMVLSSGPALRAAQRRISERILQLLGINAMKYNPEPWE